MIVFTLERASSKFISHCSKIVIACQLNSWYIDNRVPRTKRWETPNLMGREVSLNNNNRGNCACRPWYVSIKDRAGPLTLYVSRFTADRVNDKRNWFHYDLYWKHELDKILHKIRQWYSWITMLTSDCQVMISIFLIRQWLGFFCSTHPSFAELFRHKPILARPQRYLWAEGRQQQLSWQSPACLRQPRNQGKTLCLLQGNWRTICIMTPSDSRSGD